MATQVPLRCRCGQVRGALLEAAPDTGNRLVCYCDDCQAFAHFLDRPDVLDAWGGTDIFQVAPSRFTITEGAKELRCMRLSEKGLRRWYTECCKTPVGNTVSARVPFVGVIHSFVDHDRDGRAADAALGKPIAHILGAFATGDPPAYVREKPPARAYFLLARRILGWWIGRKGRPTPLYDEAGAPVATPRVLTRTERDALRGAKT